MSKTYTLTDVIHMFRLDLKGYYPDEELRDICYLSAEHLLNYSKIDFHLKRQEPISEEIHKKFHQIILRLKNWEPIQYIIGFTEFYGIRLKVDNSVMIPRPETEELVQWIINEETGSTADLLDIGTGSGCIAIALAINMKHMAVSACDVSAEALEVAKLNAKMNQVSIRFFIMDMLDNNISLPCRYGVIVSNPPYVREMEKNSMRKNVFGFEPAAALFVPDSDPLLYYRYLALIGRKYLQEGGRLYLEINENFPKEIVKLLENAGFFGLEIKLDLNGKTRMVRACK
jgi:release factor glutamine methyltransferase